jgi:4-phytase / acid phosphatase
MNFFRKLVPCILLLFFSAHISSAQKKTSEAGEEIEAVVLLSRHGVRSPLESEIRNNRFNSDPWPQWSVPEGDLTPHGALLLRQMGHYEGERYGSILARGCSLYAVANNTERTIASARAVLAGLMPQCKIAVMHMPNGKLDPLFEDSAQESKIDRARLVTAIRGELGGHPLWWSDDSRRQLASLQKILNGSKQAPRQLLNEPSVVVGDPQGRLTIRTPLAVSADFAEHFLLQYTEGFPTQKVGWGRVSLNELKDLMTLNQRYHDFVLRTPYYAKAAGSDLAVHIDSALRQAAGTAPADSNWSNGAKFVLLVGHDSNLSWLGGLLQLQWKFPDAPQNGTPPGSALAFELYRVPSEAEPRVRVFYLSQTLSQMRVATPLSLRNPPLAVPVFVPGCSQADRFMSCSLANFHRAVQEAVDSDFVETASDSARVPADWLRTRLVER